MDVYSPADSADDAEECSKLHYFAEKDRLFEVKAVLGFWGLSAIISGICGRIDYFTHTITTITAVLTEMSCKQEQSQASLSSAERS